MNNNHALWTAATALVLALVAGCASAPRVDRYVAPPVGATWITQQQDSGSYGNGRFDVPGRRAQRIWEGREMIAFEGPQTTLLAMPNGNWVTVLGRDGKPALSWDPPLSWDWPLEVGKSWTRQYKVKVHPQNQETAFEARQTVEAHEEVTVPAGTFKVFRVRTSDTLGNENLQWFSPEHGIFVKQALQRTDKHVQGPGRRDSELKTFSAPAR
ncbi:hypothetical protein [Caenimonas soli]|uniref:hypothetical protein n=1 Tax=Caenimonas soli TaxID=2735555 RepID=UPI00155718DA|nr:hypothetical protein [Caenimonas soli]NPC56134.1 hypothetical protein [Caenimonas soli]